MTNLLDETVTALKCNGVSPDEILYVQTNHGWCPWNEFAAVAARLLYATGPRPVIDDFLVVGRDWWLERYAHAHLERWDFRKLPTRTPLRVTLEQNHLLTPGALTAGLEHDPPEVRDIVATWRSITGLNPSEHFTLHPLVVTPNEFGWTITARIDNSVERTVGMTREKFANDRDRWWMLSQLWSLVLQDFDHLQIAAMSKRRRRERPEPDTRSAPELGPVQQARNLWRSIGGDTDQIAVSVDEIGVIIDAFTLSCPDARHRAQFNHDEWGDHWLVEARLRELLKKVTPDRVTVPPEDAGAILAHFNRVCEKAGVAPPDPAG